MKYIIADLDQTLLTKDKKITAYTKTIINKLRAQGYLFCFNTARSHLSALPYIEEMKPDYSILNGGGLILDIKQNIIYESLIPKEKINIILKLIKSDPEVLNFSIEAKTGLYSSDLNYIKHNKLAHYNSFKEEFNEDAYKFLLYATNTNKWINLAKKLNLDYESYFDGKWARFAASTKYKGNRALFNLLNDDTPMDYTFGDDTGDCEMINMAYHGVYLANTNPSLLKENSRLTKYDYENDGVAHYLEDLLLK